MSFSDRLIQLIIIISRFIGAVSQSIRFSSFIWLCGIPLCKCYHSFFIHSYTDGHLGYFQISSSLIKANYNIQFKVLFKGLNEKVHTKQLARCLFILMAYMKVFQFLYILLFRVAVIVEVTFVRWSTEVSVNLDHGCIVCPICFFLTGIWISSSNHGISV